MSRQNLQNRRASENFSFTCEGMAYTATYSKQDGKVVEVFLNNHKINSHADVSARDAAVVCSIALQYGVPVEVIAAALMRDPQGRPSGPLGNALDLLRDRQQGP